MELTAVCVLLWVRQGTADMVRHTKLSDVVVADYTKDPIPNKDGAVRRRSSSRDRARRDSVDSVSYEKSETGDDVSIGASWQGDGVSI